MYMQNNHNKPVRIVNVSSKMHELASGIDKDDPHFQMQNSYSSLAAYNRSKLAQVDIIYPLLAQCAVRTFAKPCQARDALYFLSAIQRLDHCRTCICVKNKLFK